MAYFFLYLFQFGLVCVSNVAIAYHCKVDWIPFENMYNFFLIANVRAHAQESRRLRGQKRALCSPGTGIRGCSEVPDLGSRNWDLGLLQNSNYS